MATAAGKAGIPMPPVRLSFSRFPLRLLIAGQTVNFFRRLGLRLVLWGYAAYRFNAGPYAVSVTIICWAARPALLSPLLGVYIDRIGFKAER